MISLCNVQEQIEGLTGKGRKGTSLGLWKFSISRLGVVYMDIYICQNKILHLSVHFTVYIIILLYIITTYFIIYSLYIIV